MYGVPAQSRHVSDIDALVSVVLRHAVAATTYNIFARYDVPLPMNWQTRTRFIEVYSRSLGRLWISLLSQLYLGKLFPGVVMCSRFPKQLTCE